MKKIIAITCGILAAGLAVCFLVAGCKKRITNFGRKRGKAQSEHDFFVE